MAQIPDVVVPVKMDPAHVIDAIDIICRHLSALREELLQYAEVLT